MNLLFLAIIDKIYRVIHTLHHYILILIFGIHGQKVPPIKNPILQKSATELAKMIRERELTSESVVKAFIDRIVEVEPLINATVDCRFSAALAEARDADSMVAHGTMSKEQLEIEKPLLGVPFTVKVLLTVKGLRSTGASLLFKDIRAQDDAATVSSMKAAGAIVVATTNSSEAGLNFQASNNIHGTTCNPYDTNRTSGGSSGGESAILAAAGSVIGLGNDLAGSIRVPCMFTGLFGHKPSRGLVPNDGCFPSPSAKVDVMVSTGPMCRYAEDLVTTMKILRHPKYKAMKFGEKVNFENIKVYYLFSFGDLPLAEQVDSDIKDAVKKVVSNFESLGSKVKEIDIPLFKRSFPIFMYSLLSSVPDIPKALTAGKGKVNGILELLKFLCFRSIFTFGYIIILNAHKLPFLYYPNLVDFYKKLADELDDKLHELLDDKSILVMPTIPFPAPYHHEITLMLGSTVYTSIFNTLGMPSTQCPVGFNKQGLPIGVQILSRRENDHLTIACAQEVEKAFGGWKPPKST